MCRDGEETKHSTKLGSWAIGGGHVLLEGRVGGASVINVFIPTVIDEHQKSQEGRVTNKWYWDSWLITVVKMSDSPVNFGPKENSYGLEKKNLKIQESWVTFVTKFPGRKELQKRLMNFINLGSAYHVLLCFFFQLTCKEHFFCVINYLFLKMLCVHIISSYVL